MKRLLQISALFFLIMLMVFRPESINNQQPIYRAEIKAMQENSNVFTDYDNLAVFAKPYAVNNFLWFKTFYLTDNNNNSIMCISMRDLPSEGLMGQYIVRLKRPIIINGEPLILYLKLIEKPDMNLNISDKSQGLYRY